MWRNLFICVGFCITVCWVSSASNLTKEGDFHYVFVKRFQDKWDKEPISDEIEEPDMWPNGLYTLFMTKYGCPAGRWNRGYISFTWRTPHVMLSDTDTFDEADKFDWQWHRLMSERTWPSHSYLYGPFSQYKMTLNFCQRMKAPNKESNTWSGEHIRLFDANTECPKAFHSVTRSLILPPVDSWAENGFLPFFTVNTEDTEKTIFTIRECLQDRANNKNPGYLSSRPDSSFILLKHEDNPCPVMKSYSMWHESIALVPLQKAFSNVTRLFQLCYYQPNYWSLDDFGKNKDDTSRKRPPAILEYYLDYVIRPCRRFDDVTGETTCDMESDAYTHSMFGVENVGWWILIDLGRALFIKAVSITPQSGIPGRTDEVRDLAAHAFILVEAENDRWSLLRYGGVEISTGRVRQTFNGRYILFKISESHILLSHINFRLFVKRSHDTCMFDLGMTDGSITRSQISSSDHDDKKLDSVRAYNSGWCANSKDTIPYLQIDLLKDTPVDGMSVHNWYKTDVNITNGEFSKTFKPMGIQTFTLTYSSDGKAPNNMTFHMDMFRPLDEPRTFMFHKQIVARYIRVNLIEPLTKGELCIKFELHGCRKYDGMTIAPSLHYMINLVDTDSMCRAVQTLKSPGRFTNIGFPNSYRDGTTYSWIVDFRSVGYINVIFKQIRLQNYEDRTFSKSWYRCRDTFNLDSKYPCSECHWKIPSGYHTHWIIQTDLKYLVMSFTSCNPYTPRSRQDLNFIAFVEKSDIATCDGRPGYGNCTLSTMLLSTLPLMNSESKYYPDKLSWNIVVDALYIRLNIKYFHIECYSGTFLKIIDPISNEVVHTNCKPPSTTLLTDSNRLSVIYQISKNISVSAYSIKEGFKALYSSMEFNSPHYENIRKHGNEVWRKQNDIDPRLSKVDFSLKAASTLLIRDCTMAFKKCYYTFFGKPSSWDDAFGECWIRGMSMLSIRSPEELLLVKSMTRASSKELENAIEKQTEFNKDDPKYYLHIGLNSRGNADGRRRFVWYDGTATIFSAWNAGEPKQGNTCARMNFYLAKNNTWEVEDCKRRNSLFFICEEFIEQIPTGGLEDSWKPSEFQGFLMYTENGRRCQPWEDLGHTEYTDDDFPDATVHDASNYCRDPKGEKNALWCYTKANDTSSWETCRLLGTTSDRCDGIMNYYNGTLNVTYDGFDCMRWDSPNVPWEVPPKYFPTGKMHHENYCREFFEPGFLWCFKQEQDEEPRWEYCDLEDTESSTDDNYTESVYLCNNGVQISTHVVCNGIVDCVDAEDELNCSVNIHRLIDQQKSSDGRWSLHATRFVCGSNETITFLAHCDGITDCIDGSDEIHCNRKKKECSKDEFECGDGSCIHTSLMCDFIPHCKDFSDEDCVFTRCNQSQEKCDNNQCIEKSRKCDSHIDCVDGSDEKKCDYCNGNTIHCDENKCIDNVRVCDGIADCNDGTDESNCKDKHFPTCEERWLNGFRKNGEYSLSETAVAECNFDALHDEGKVTTIFHSYGRLINKRETYIDTPGISEQELRKFLLEYDCRQTITQICTFPLQSLNKLGEKYDEQLIQECCVALTIIYDKNSTFVHDCHNDTNIVLPSIFKAKYQGDKFRAFKTYQKKFTYTFGPIVCRNREKIHLDENEDTAMMLPCEDRGEYNTSLRCIYESDEMGTILGCRSGSHLQGCHDVECPDGTVKCPGSFCLPLNYICDGINQCPGNEDEFGCDCSSDNLELILFINEEDVSYDQTTIRQIAEQFNNRKAIVRILKYNIGKNTKPIDETSVHIVDKLVHHQPDKTKETSCTYALRASALFQSVKFSNNNSRAFIFIQNGSESQSAAELIFSNMSKPDLDIFRVLIGPLDKSMEVKKNAFRHVTDITIDKFGKLLTLGSIIFSTLCKDSSANLCRDNFKCSSSKRCIRMDQVCDGRVHCPFSDDEIFCNFVCPPSCICSGFNVYCSFSESINYTDVIKDMDERLRVLDLSRIAEVGSIINSAMDNSVMNFPYMIKLNLSECDIMNISKTILDRMPNLRSLDLSHNKISKIRGQTFSTLSRLVYLTLNGNKALITFESNAFFGLQSLRNFDMNGLHIDSISSKAFSGLKLVYLNVSRNNIIRIDSNAFSDISVKTFIFESNAVENFDEGLFNGVSDLETLRTSFFKYCCVRPYDLPESSCFPEADEFSSCEDLMKNSALQTMLWLMGICALFGNLIAIVYRIVYDRERLKLGFGIFVSNLAIADLLMGVYLLIIAVADASFRKRYIFVDEYWRNSVWCTLAGVLSTVSSEASVSFLCLITLDRLIVIKYPFSQLRFTPRNAGIAASMAWILSIGISVTPLIAQDHFQNKFYAKSGVCVPLPLTRDRPPGWLYSVFVFIGLNFVTFICIAIGQLSIYLEINAVSSKIKNRYVGRAKDRRRKELTIARNLLLVVVTDFLCWFPVGCMGIMAMTGHVIPGEVYAWVAVFVLPVNSALNPVLYTLTSRAGRENKRDIIEVSSKTMEKKAAKKHDFGKQLSYFLHRDVSSDRTMESVDTLLKKNMKITPKELLKFTVQLTDCIRLLHSTSMAIESLNARTVYVTVEHGKVTGDIQIRQQPKRGASIDDRTENMYALGSMVLRLMENSCD